MGFSSWKIRKTCNYAYGATKNCGAKCCILFANIGVCTRSKLILQYCVKQNVFVRLWLAEVRGISIQEKQHKICKYNTVHYLFRFSLAEKSVWGSLFCNVAHFLYYKITTSQKNSLSWIYFIIWEITLNTVEPLSFEKFFFNIQCLVLMRSGKNCLLGPDEHI